MSTEAEMAEQVNNNATEEPPADDYDNNDAELQVSTGKDEPPTDETAENDDGELYDEETFLMPDEELFDGSTHQFAINYGRTKNFDGCLIGYFVIIVQFVLYGVVASDVFDGLSGGDFAIPVQVQFGKSCTEMKDVTKDGVTTSQPANLLCPPDVPNYLYLCLAATLLTFFIMHDILATVRILKTFSKKCCDFTNPAWIAASIILIEALFAAMIGTLFALKATSGYDAVGNCIGILFIHDADEVAYDAFMVINVKQAKTGKCKGKCCCCWGRVRIATVFVATFIFVAFACVLASGLRSAQKAQIVEAYGDDYWDDWFSAGGGYNWNFDSNPSYLDTYGADTNSGSGSGIGSGTPSPTIPGGTPSPTFGF